MGVGLVKHLLVPAMLGVALLSACGGGGDDASTRSSDLPRESDPFCMDLFAKGKRFELADTKKVCVSSTTGRVTTIPAKPCTDGRSMFVASSGNITRWAYEGQALRETTANYEIDFIEDFKRCTGEEPTDNVAGNRKNSAGQPIGNEVMTAEEQVEHSQQTREELGLTEEQLEQARRGEAS